MTRTEFVPALQEWLLPSRTMKRRIWPPLIGLLYIAAIAMLGGLRSDHVLIGCLGFLDAYNEKSRSFLREFFPFILTGAIYDSMRYYYWQGIAGHVHVAGPYEFEKRWFGVGSAPRLTLNEYFAQHHWAVADLASGFAYLTFVAELVCLAIFLFFKGELRPVRTLAWSFLIVNLLGFATYYIFPVAPPWYVAQYGFGPVIMNIHPSAASASRFDLLLGTHLFTHMYDRGVDVYGAYPSLHVAYPLISLITIWTQTNMKRARIPAVLFWMLMCFSAIYLQHHYVTDALLGFAFALTTLWIVGRLQRQREPSRASVAQPAASGSAPMPGSRPVLVPAVASASARR